jgi:ribosomal-protein-alanine N-acetyltransferase
MYDELENLYALCFPEKKQKWTANDFSDLKKSGCEIIASQNSFVVWRNIGDETEILSIGVVPAARRSGTASALLQIIEQDIKQLGVKTIFLEVDEFNIPAIELYKKTGFFNVGRRPHYYDNGHDAIIMKKEI